MHYFIYRITNLLTNKFFIGKFVGNTIKFKLTHSSNKFLKDDIKKYGYKNFKREILQEFNNEKDLNYNYKKIVTKDFKNREDTYNYIYSMSIFGKQHISVGRRSKETEKLKLIYPKFEYDLKRYNKTYYLIKNFCKHGDLIIKISDFDKIYNDNNKFYCPKCFNEFMNHNILSDAEITNNIQKLKNILISAKSHAEDYLKRAYPTVYKSILDWSKQYKNISFEERLFLAKKMLKNIPKCICCDNDAYFSKTHTRYSFYCKTHILIHKSSKEELELYDFIKSNVSSNIYNNFIIQKYKLDIYIPTLNLAFEFNGLYWHSEEYRDKSYHYNKWICCKNNNIRLITIWEDDWRNKKEIVKSIIKNILGLTKYKIYARNTQIRKINTLTTKKFLDDNHIQGWCQSPINLGLYYNDELVSLMTFGKKRKITNQKSENNQYELLRFCSKLNTNVIGGANKLFNSFIKQYDPIKIISYASCDISDGHLYDVLGFTFVKHTGINYWWAKDKRYHRSNFMKYKLIKSGFNPYSTEDEIMYQRKYTKIFGIGNLKYEWNKL